MAGEDGDKLPAGQNPASKEASSVNPSPEPIEWTMENEINLFEAMIGHRPAGINKHFNMLFIRKKMSNALNREVSSDCIWKYLSTVYDLDMLDEIEGIHFPNNVCDFFLPESEYGELMKQKLKEVSTKTEEAEDRSASPRVQNRSRSQSRGAAYKKTVSKLSKKETNEKTAKNQSHEDTSVVDNPLCSDVVIVTPKMNKDKNYARRDSKDASSSNREVIKELNTGASKSTAKDSKTLKSSRTSFSEKLDESATNKKVNKISTRASLKPEESTPPIRKRRYKNV